MNMIRRRPEGSLAHFIRDFYPDFEKSWLADFPNMPTVAGTQWQPSVDIKEEGNNFIIVADIPGVDPKDIEVHMENGMLTIRGERETEKKEKSEDYKRVEREYGSFERRFTLPEAVDAEAIKAKSKHGVLQLTIPKTSGKQGRKKINIEE